MFKGIIKEYDSNKCIKIAIRRKGGFFSKSALYNVKIYTTRPRQKVPKEEETLKAISSLLLDKEWNTEQNNKEGYTHRTTLKDYTGLNFLIKEIKE